MSSDGRVYISKDVIFNESEFPFSSLKSSSSVSPVSSSSHFPSVIPTIFTSSSIPPPNPTLQVSVNSSEPASSSPIHTTSPPIQPVAELSPLPTSPPSTEPPDMSSDMPSLSATTPLPPLSKPVVPHTINSHPMVTRGKTGNLKPKVFLAHSEPSNVKQALSDPQWLTAMKAEYSALMNNQTWSLVPLPAHRRAIGCKWVFRIKENPDGSVNKYKACLVAKGYSQEQGFDYNETFSPVVKPVTIRIILTLAISFKWDIQQIDINNAFLNGILQEEVYMTQPPGFISSDSSLVCRLHRALYGLKQAPRAWYDRLTQALILFGFQPSKCDPSLFVYNHKGITLYVLVYVDDILLTGSSSTLLQDLISKLNSQFALKHMGKPDYFLGIEVHHLPNGNMLLTQSKYIRDLLHRANMAEAKGITTPMVSSLKLSRFGPDSLPDPHEYRSIVGALQYVTLTRPEIAFCVNKVCQFLSSPLLTHWQAVKRILRYLLHTCHHGLLLQPSSAVSKFSINAYSDSDWASDLDDRRSTSGSCIFFGPNLVSWSAKKQSLVARSSAEAEYRSLAHTTSELLWIQSLLTDLHIPIHTPVLLCDNISAVMIAHNPVLHARTKHLELDLHFVRERVLAKALNSHHVPGVDQIADALTKPLPTARFLALRDKLKVFASQPPSA
jgi:histone deacetylase 1/2